MTARLRRAEPNADLLAYLQAFSETNGYAPSLRDICAAGHASSTSMASFYLAELEARGLIRRRRGIARGITVVREGGAV